MFEQKQSKHTRDASEPFSIQGRDDSAQSQVEQELVDDSFDCDSLHDGESALPALSALPQEDGEEVDAASTQDEASAPCAEAPAADAPSHCEEPEAAEDPDGEAAEGPDGEIAEGPDGEITDDDEEQQEVKGAHARVEEPAGIDLQADYVATYKVPVMPALANDSQSGVAFGEPLPTVPAYAPFDAVGAMGVAPAGGTQMVVEAPKEHKTGKTVGIVLGVIAGLLLIAYCIGLAYFAGHMFPHTEVGDSDVSFMSTEDVQNHLEAKTANYVLRVSGYGYELNLPGENINFAFDSAAVARSMHARQNIFTWPAEFFRDHDYTEQVVATYDEALVRKLVNETVETHNASATSPTDACLGYDDASARIVVVPEEYGTKLDANATNAAVKKAICSATRVLALSQDQLVKPTVTKDSAQLQKAAEGCNGLTSMNITFTVDGQEAFKAGLPCVYRWVDIADDGSVTLSDEKISDWISQTAADYTTLGNTRTYTRPDGKEVTVTGGDYGWEVDEDEFSAIVLAGLATGAQETVEMPFTERGTVFNGVGKQDWGKRYIDVDMTEQHAYMYDDNGELIWETDVITGNINIADRATPEGVWSINLMGKNVTLHTIEAGKEEASETLVLYWMPFVGNTVGLHDAWWQPGFGGTMYRDGYGSHGCVNLPSSAAADLFSLAQVGDVVVTHW